MVLLAALAGWSNGGEIEYGLAARYPNDAGIQMDPDVILLEDYELDGMDALAHRGWRWSPGAQKRIYRLSTDPKVPFAGQTCLVKKAAKGHTGAIMPHDLDPAENGAVYHRVYLKYPRDGPAVRVMGICGVRDGWPTWKAIGSAGVPADGTNYWCLTLTFRPGPGGYRPMWYPYHADQKGPWGSNWPVDANVPADRWFCLEIMTRLTTAGKRPGTEDGHRDGELRMWIDGREVYARTDLCYRTVAGVRTNMIFDQCYSSRGFPEDALFFADNRVVARKYVGPMVKVRRRPTHPSVTGKAVEAPAARLDDTSRGIASRYPDDLGIERDPHVILFDDYEVDSLAALQSKGWVPRHGPGLWKDGRGKKLGWHNYAIRHGPGVAFTGRSCLENRAVAKEYGQMMTFDLPQGEEVVFHRFYMKLARKLPAEISRIAGVTGAAEGEPTWHTYGAETPRSDGTGPFWTLLTLWNWQQDGQIKRRNLRIESKKTDDHFVLRAAEDLMPVDKWFCLEMMTRLNTPGKKDGQMRVWLDGREVFRHTGIWWRNVPRVKIRAVCDQFYADRTTFPGDGLIWVDNRVIARKYVGPMRREHRDSL